MHGLWLGKRSFQRASLKSYLEVHDRDTDTLVGRVLDISTDGVRLISDQPFPLKQNFRFWVIVPGTDGRDPERIALDAESLWSERDVNEDFFDTGFRLLELDATVSERIKALAREWSFDA